MLNRLPRLVLWLIVLGWLGACGGGGGSGGAAAAPGGDGTVPVVVDTALGADGLLQFLVTAASLERTDGSSTGNVLAAPLVVTFTDPSGEASALTLAGVPPGSYRSLDLLLAPETGIVVRADGSVQPATTAATLRIPLREELVLRAPVRGWLLVGNDPGSALVDVGGTTSWLPRLSGRFDASEVRLADLRPRSIGSDSVSTTAPFASEATLQLDFAPGATLEDDQGTTYGSRAEFLAGLSSDDDLRIGGELRRDGSCLVRRARRGRGNDGPRLLGRIVELRPAATSFVLRVQAEVRRGERRFLQPPVDVLVLAAQARIVRPDAPATIPFGALAVGDLAKVKWTSRTEVPGALTEYVAREIEVPDGNVPPQVEWQGRVDVVDLATSRIVVEPRGDDPIVIGGVVVSSANVDVTATTTIERRERNGGGRTTIGIADIVVGDRIWWRGTVTGPATIAASTIRVREE
jgi:hypothetical protein